jgi:hypothetical protein
MRKSVLLMWVLAAAAVSSADDAFVVPKSVIRLTAGCGYATAARRFDDDGDRVDLAGDESLKTFNVGGAIEYGISEGTNMFAWWVPGYIVLSQFDSSDKKKSEGPFDLFFGFKIQLLGDDPAAQAWRNETMRLAIAFGMLAPISAPDFWDEADHYNEGKDYIARRADKHVGGPWGRVSFDYVVNEMFFVNAHVELIKYMEKDYYDALVILPPAMVSQTTVFYGHQLTLEVEPHFEMGLASGMRLKAGLPIAYASWPELVVTEDEIELPDTDGYLLSLRPHVGLALKALLPIEVEIGYVYRLAGRNTELAEQQVTLQVSALLDFRKKTPQSR